MNSLPSLWPLYYVDVAFAIEHFSALFQPIFLLNKIWCLLLFLFFRILEMRINLLSPTMWNTFKK